MPEKARFFRSAISSHLRDCWLRLPGETAEKQKRLSSPNGTRGVTSVKPSWCHPNSSNTRPRYQWAALLLMYRYGPANKLPSRYLATLTVGFPASSYWLLRSARGSQDHSAPAPLPAFTCSGSLWKVC